jgi:hypothetical protein
VRVLLAAVFLAVAACGTSEADSPEQTAADEAGAGVCRALEATEGGDEDKAKAVFDDDAHVPLHDLADAVGDRAVKADLLEAKSRVERGDYSASALAALERAVGDAAEAADLSRPEPCDG